MVHLLLSMPGWLMCTLQRNNKEEQTYTKYACHQYKEAQITTVACMNMYMYMYAHLHVHDIQSDPKRHANHYNRRATCTCTLKCVSYYNQVGPSSIVLYEHAYTGRYVLHSKM